MNGTLTHHFVKTVLVIGWDLPVTTLVLMEQRHLSTLDSVNVIQVLLDLAVTLNVLSMVKLKVENVNATM